MKYLFAAIAIVLAFIVCVQRDSLNKWKTGFEKMENITTNMENITTNAIAAAMDAQAVAREAIRQRDELSQ